MNSPSTSPTHILWSFDLVTSPPLCRTLISHSKRRDPRGKSRGRGMGESSGERVRGCRYFPTLPNFVVFLFKCIWTFFFRSPVFILLKLYMFAPAYPAPYLLLFSLLLTPHLPSVYGRGGCGNYNVSDSWQLYRERTHIRSPESVSRAIKHAHNVLFKC